MRKKHRFPASCDYVATEAINGTCYIAYHLDYWTGEIDVDRICFGHGSTLLEAIADLQQTVEAVNLELVIAILAALLIWLAAFLWFMKWLPT